jgi:polyferredoxin/Tfp pilus assembly protein PilF
MQLPVHQPKPTVIRPSTAAPWRALVLATVQLLIIAHIAVWWFGQEQGWFGGKTITPIEPSEAMDFAKRGWINAGLIFFSAALLATLIFGRWFCGWGCHVVLLQDLCGWMMRKVGVRPKPFRSRLLALVPLTIAFYMFIWPWLDRLLTPELSWPGVTWHLTTADFWRTFPGVMVAIPFLLVCGFGTVYFLGNKGFCTYGCPYGGFFAPLEQLSTGRIRVNDDCQESGHCTAVCSSNVRVHEEVRDFKMVIDPGCMKCMDCVTVCPNEALSYSRGPSAIKVAGWRFAKRWTKSDLSWKGEVTLAVVFLISFLSVRGVYGVIPLLFAAGIASITTFLVALSWRVCTKQNVSLHRAKLRFHGTISGAGWLFLVTTAVVIVGTAHSGLVNSTAWIGSRLAQDLPHAFEPATAAQQEQAASAMTWYEWSLPAGDGGVALVPTPDFDLAMARLAVIGGDLKRATQLTNRVMAMARPDSRVILFKGHLLLASKAFSEAAEHYIYSASANPEMTDVQEATIRFLLDAGAPLEALDTARQAMGAGNMTPPLVWSGGVLELNFGHGPRGVELLTLSTIQRPSDPRPLLTMATYFISEGDHVRAVELVDRAEAIGSTDPEILEAIAAIREVLSTRP